MRRLALAPVFGVALIFATPATAQNAQQRVEWNRPAEPFRIIGNVYYVGTEGLAAYLVAGPKGHVLIDGGLPESAPLIAANVERLGFRLSDVRYLLINHSHFDHSGGLAELKRRTGAKLVASRGDAPDLRAGRTLNRPELDGFPPVTVERLIGDGGRVRLSGIELVAHLTPGHTKGCTSWGVRTEQDGRAYDVLFACSITVAGQKLRTDPAYPNAAGDFRRTYAKLRTLKTDVFLNFHPEFFDFKAKRAKQQAGDPLAFVDPAELGRQVDRAERAFQKELDAQSAQ